MTGLKRSNNKKKTSKSSFDFKNDIKKELNKKIQFKKDQTANKIISSSMSPKKNISYGKTDLKLDLSPSKKNTPNSPFQLKLELSPTKTIIPASPLDLKKELTQNIERENGKQDTGKVNQLYKPEFIVPNNRKFSILDISSFYPEKKVELLNKNKAYFLLANSE
jgi:hypothetical protein